ncbi:MAG TPA: bifunctional DNA primase/polymerase, partial [Thermoleophilia bacterium]
MTKHGFLDATTDEAQIREWWTARPTALVGVATGASGLVIADVDTHGEVDGYVAWHDLTAPAPELEDTALVKTPSGGQHAYYRTNGHKVANSTGRLGPGIDVRAEGGYVIAAGNPGYEYVDGHGPERVAELPAVLAEKVAYRRTQQPVIPEAVLGIPEGSRNGTLTSRAGTMRRTGMSEDAIEAALLAENKAHCKPSLPDDEVRTIAHSVARYEPSSVHDCSDDGNAQRLIS